MVASCCVKDCHNKQDRESARRFFSIPTVTTHKGADLFNLTTRRRRAWLAVLRLKGFRFDTKTRRFVCSDHFVRGCPAYVRLVNDPDWKPSLRLGYEDGELTDLSTDSSSTTWKLQTSVVQQPESGDQRSAGTREQVALSHGHCDDAGSGIMAASHDMIPENMVREAAHKATQAMLGDSIKTGSLPYNHNTCQRWENTETEPASHQTVQPCENIKAEPASCEITQPCENTEGEPALCETSRHLRTRLKIKTESGQAQDTEVNDERREGEDCQVKREPAAHTCVASLQQEKPLSSSCPVRQEGDVRDWDGGQSPWEPSSEQSQANMESTPRQKPSPHNAQFQQTPGNTGPTPVLLVANLGSLLLGQPSSPDLEQGRPSGRSRKRAATAQQYLCGVCSKPFNRPSKLKAHMLIHTDEKPFVCDVCNKAFKQACNLKAHKLIHTSQRSYVCEVCSEVFTDSSALKTHKLIHADHKPFVCNVCNLGFSLPEKLKKHKLIHNRPKAFVCNVCREAFDKASSLKAHKLSHTGQMPFVCSLCSKGFRAASNLKRHMLIHSGQKPYACDVCNKAFNQASALKTHKLIHTGQKPFVCDACDKAFNQACNLKTHKLTHLGLKPYVCDVCNKAYSRADHLKTHKQHH